MNLATSDPSSFDELVPYIKGRGHWRVVARPLVHQPEALGSLSALPEIATQCCVRVRGWYFPHIDHREPWAVHTLADGIRGGGVFEEIAESWRLHCSGQFAHIDSLVEDHIAEDMEAGRRRGWSIPSGFKAGGRYLDFLGALYHLTEAYVFTSRLAEHDAYKPGCRVVVELHNCKGRELFAWQPGRGLYIGGPRVCHEETLQYRPDPIAQADMIAGAPELALDAWVYFMERFNFLSPARGVFAEDQRKLLERRL